MLTTIAAGRVYSFSHAVGGVTGFSLPTSLAIGRDSVVYVISRGSESNFSSRVSKVAIGPPGDEKFLCEFGKHGDTDGQTIWPSAVALDKEENVYVTDEWLHRIAVFESTGTFLGSWGTHGTGDGELNRPSGMVIDPEDHLYIIDSHNNRIQKFTQNGTFLSTFGEEGSGEGQFNQPWGVTIDNQGNIYVADWGNHRIQKFSSDGAFVGSFGTFGSGVGQLNYPTDVAVDDDGDVYVADWANHRVQIFASNGDFITSLNGDAHQLAKWAQLTVDANPDIMKARRRVKSLEPQWRLLFPASVAFDKAGSRLLIADCQRYRIQIYIKDMDYVDPQFNL